MWNISASVWLESTSWHTAEFCVNQITHIDNADKQRTHPPLYKKKKTKPNMLVVHFFWRGDGGFNTVTTYAQFPPVVPPAASWGP